LTRCIRTAFAGLLCTTVLVACSASETQQDAEQGSPPPSPLGAAGGDSEPSSQLSAALTNPPVPEPGTEIAIFAGGCFWCMEPPFDALEGVLSTTSGYTGGREDQPTYRRVSSGVTGHLEAIQVVYDPSRVRYDDLLAVFWRNVDPLDAGGQFCDRGEQYTTAIFTLDAEQREAAERSKRSLQRTFAGGDDARGDTKGRLVTAIRPAATFYPAEDYHQDYYRTNPTRYKLYRAACRRDSRLEDVWSDVPSSAFAWGEDGS